MKAPDLHQLLASWELSLRAERKSPQTVKSYSTSEVIPSRRDLLKAG